MRLSYVMRIKMSRVLDYARHRIMQSVFIHEDIAVVESDLDRL